jgi:hypothetical protein
MTTLPPEEPFTIEEWDSISNAQVIEAPIPPATLAGLLVVLEMARGKTAS